MLFEISCVANQDVQQNQPSRAVSNLIECSIKDLLTEDVNQIIVKSCSTNNAIIKEPDIVRESLNMILHICKDRKIGLTMKQLSSILEEV